MAYSARATIPSPEVTLHRRTIALSAIRRLLRLAGPVVALLTSLIATPAEAQLCADNDPCQQNQAPSISLWHGHSAPIPQTVTISIIATDDGWLPTAGYSLTRNGSPVSLTGTMQHDYTSLSHTGTLQLVTGTNTLIVSICDQWGTPLCAADTLVIEYTAPPTPPDTAAPVATLAQDNTSRRLNDCATCAPGVLSYSTPEVVKNGAPWSASLVYSTETARPTGYVEVDAVITSSAAPHRISLQVKRRSTGQFMTLSSGGTEAFVRGDTGHVRLAAQFDASGLQTGAYLFDVIVSTHWGTSSPYTRLSDTVPLVRLLIQNEQSSPYGPGWTVAGVGRVFPDSGGVMLTDGAGGLAWFTQAGACGGSPWKCTYTSPTGDFTTLSRHVRTSAPYDTVWTRVDRSGGSTVYSGTGLMHTYTDRYGNLSYVDHAIVGGGVARVTDMYHVVAVGGTQEFPNVPYAAFAYDGTTGKLIRITLPDGRKSTFAIHGSDSTIITDPDTIVAMRVRTKADTLTSWGRNKAPAVLQLDAFGQARRAISAPVTIDNGTSASDTTTFASLRAKLLTGQASSVTAACSLAVRVADAFLEVKAQNGTKNRTWGHLSGQPARATATDSAGVGPITTWVYNANYLPTNVTTSGRGGTEYTWSGTLMTEERDLGSGSVAQYWHTKFDQLDSVRVNGVRLLRQFFTDTLRLHADSVLSDSLNMTRYTYDAQGRVLTVKDSKNGQVNATVTMTYALPHGNVTSLVRTASGLATETTSFQYDSAGRVWKVTDPNSRVFETTYDKLNRVKQELGPLSTTSTYAYNDTSGTYTFTDPNGQVYREAVNARGWVVAMADPRQTLASPNVDSMFYDRFGRLTKRKDRRGAITVVKYDGLGRVTERVATMAGVADTTQFGYDPNQRWVSAKNSESTDTLRVDNAGRTVKSTTVRDGKTFNMVYAYEAPSLLSRVEVSRDSGAAQIWIRKMGFSYNAAMNQSYVVDFGNKGTFIHRNREELVDTVALPTHTSYASRVKRLFAYNSGNQVTSDTYTGAPYDLLSRTYSARDKLGRVTDYSRNTTSTPIQRYHAYDALGRVTSFQAIQDTSWIEINWIPWDPYNDCPGCTIPDTTIHYGYNIQSANYTYDAVGNRTDRLTHGGQIATGNRITVADGYTISYDSAGNILGKSKTGDNHTYTWNALGQLTQVTNNAGTTYYGYDGWGRRVRKTVGSTVTRYLLDGDRVLIDVDASHAPLAEYNYYEGSDRPHSMKRGGVLYYYTQDEQGNVVGLINQSGGVAANLDYTPYGEEMDGWSSVANHYRYKGREWDAEAGLYFMRARYYEPKLGRFLSEDPIGLAGGINPTAFVDGDPVNFADPLGLCRRVTYQTSWKGNARNPETGAWGPREVITGNATAWVGCNAGFRRGINESIFRGGPGEKDAPPDDWYRTSGPPGNLDNAELPRYDNTACRQAMAEAAITIAADMTMVGGIRSATKAIYYGAVAIGRSQALGSAAAGAKALTRAGRIGAKGAQFLAIGMEASSQSLVKRYAVTSPIDIPGFDSPADLLSFIPVVASLYSVYKTFKAC